MVQLDSPYMVSLIMFNGSTWPNSAPLQDTCIRLRNMSDLEFYLSKSLKGRCNGALGLPIQGFLLMLILK